MTGQYFQRIIKNKAALIVNIGKWEKRKRKNKSLFLKYLQTATSKATQPLRYDDPGKVKPLQSDVVVYLQLFPIRISWEFKQFTFSLVSFKHIWDINTITVVLICTGNIVFVLAVIASTSHKWPVLRPLAIFAWRLFNSSQYYLSEVYSEPCQTSKIEKIVNGCNYFCIKLHITRLSKFWVCICLCCW